LFVRLRSSRLEINMARSQRLCGQCDFENVRLNVSKRHRIVTTSKHRYDTVRRSEIY